MPTKSDDSYKIPVKTSTKGSTVYEVVTHFVDLSIYEPSPMPWQFQIHFKYVYNDTLVQHDIVYLRHTNNGGILSAIGGDIVLKYGKDESEGLHFYYSLWEIEKYTDTARVYILRHLMSGMTLGVKRNSKNYPDSAILIDISEGPGNCYLGSVELKLAKKDGGEITSESFIYMCEGDYTLDIIEENYYYMGQSYVHSSIRKDASSMNITDEQLVNLTKMKKLAKNFLEYNVKKLQFCSDIPKNCFVIQEIDDSLKKYLLFALSFHSTIINLREDLKWGATYAMKKVSYIRMMKVTEKIAYINDFLKDCSSSDPKKEFLKPIYKRQMICKDLGLSELLLYLLFYIRENTKELIFKDKANYRYKFFEMHVTIYRVLINLIKDNELFKIHVSKWITFILEDFIEKNEYIEDIHYEALMELLKGNSFFVENFVTAKMIDYLLENMLKYRTIKGFVEKRYLDVLRAFCIVDYNVFSLNQSLILKHFIEKLEKIEEGKIYQVKFLKKDGKIYIKASLDKKTVYYFRFEDFQEKCKELDGNGFPKYKNTWYYCTAYMNLLADMTKGRNKSVEAYVAKYLPLEILSETFDKYSLGDFYVPVIKIIHYLYSENENFYPIEKEKRIIIYDEIENSEIYLNHFTGPLSPWDSMYTILMKLLYKLRQAEPILADYYSKNQILYELLKLTEYTLNLGFWLSKENIQYIFENILRILYKHPQTNYYYVLKNNKYNALMINCKIECLNIIDLIINQDMGIVLQVYNKVFREFEIKLKEKDVNASKNGSTLIQSYEDIYYARHFYYTIYSRSKEVYSIVDHKIYDQLLELGKYGSAILTSKSLAILNRILDHKKHRMNFFYTQLFVCEPESVKFAEFLGSLKNKFFTLEDINTPKITLENQSENYFNIYCEQSRPYKPSLHSGIMQDMYIITELMKNENELSKLNYLLTLDDSGTFYKLASDYLINFTDECKSSNLMKQKIVDATNIHHKVLSFISHCYELPTPVSELALKLLHLSYKFIVGLIENHQEMKPKIVPYLPVMMKHLSFNIGCIDLLREMYDNNKNMLYNDAYLLVLIRSICDHINKYSNYLYKAKLLDFFRYLIYLNGTCIRNNQILILKIMQDDDYTEILQEVTVEKVKSFVEDYKKSNNNFKYNDDGIVEVDPELLYLSTYFQIISSLIDQNNSVNIGKLVKRLPFELLSDCIIACYECWFLKRNIRAVINRMYYFYVGTNAYLSMIIKEETPSMIYDLDCFIRTKLLPEEEIARLYKLYFRNPVRFTYLYSYFYLNLYYNLFSLFSILNTKELFDEWVKIQSSPNCPLDFSYLIIRVAERLGQLRRYFTAFSNVHTTSIIKFLQLRIKFILDTIKTYVYEKNFEERKMKLLSTGKGEWSKYLYKKTRNDFIEKIIDGDIAEFYLNGSEEYKRSYPLVYSTKTKQAEPKYKKEKDDKKLSRKLKEIFTRKKRLFSNRDEYITYKMYKIVSAMKMSKYVNNLFTRSFEKNLIYCSKRGKDGQKYLLEYITILIRINAENPYILSEDLKIFLLKIINSLFYYANSKKEDNKYVKYEKEDNQIYEYDEEKKPLKGLSEEYEEIKYEYEEDKKYIDYWEAYDWEYNYTEIKNLQLKLMDCGVGSFITSLIKYNICNNITLANSILLCSISYMLGGNKVTQNNIREELNKDPENKLLINIKKLINKLGVLIRKNIDYENITNKYYEYISDFIIKYIDNYDFYDEEKKYMTRKNVSEPHYVDETLYYKECIVTYRRAFKFMQLLCENNNIDNKNFIREQPETSESIDFIEIATKYLRNIFGVLCSYISYVPIFILDFILEVTQIPVKLNQDALIRSSFFEDVCLLSNCLSKEEELKERGFEQDREHIDEIFQKVVQIILSNFYGNNPDYFILLDEKLDPDFLIKLLREKLSALNIATKADFYEYLEEMTKPVPKEDGGLKSSPDLDENICSILEIIIIFVKLRDVVGEKSKVYTAYVKEKAVKDKNDRKSNEYLFETLESYLLRIEITDSNGVNQDVYFPKHPVFESLSDGLKDYVMSEVTRNTHSQKITSLLSFVNSINDKILEAYMFKKCYNKSETVMSEYYSTATNLSICICLYMIMFYTVYIYYGSAEYTASWPIVICRFILSLFQFKYSILYGWTWYKLNVWVKPEQETKKGGEDYNAIKDYYDQEYVGEIENVEEPGVIAKKFKYIKGKIGEKVDYLCAKYPIANEVLKELKQAKYAFFPEDPEAPRVQNSGEFYKILIYILVSFFGTFFYPPLIFIHLIDKLCSDETLGNIFQAIGFVAKQLLYVSLMGVAFVVVFSTITFSNYMRNVYDYETYPYEMCTGIVNCILALFVSGAISETMEKFEIVRFGYDMIYGIFFGLLFSNIISGLMLDAFGELGETADYLDNDKKNFCYICNIDREKLEKNLENFDDHITKKHHLWNYIFYIISLYNKNKTDYTGLYYYISQKYNQQDKYMDVSWIPNGGDSEFDMKYVAEYLIQQFDYTQDTIAYSCRQLETQIDDFVSLAHYLQKV